MMVDLRQKKNMAQLGIKDKVNLISMHDQGPSAANKRKREKRKVKKEQDKSEKNQAD